MRFFVAVVCLAMGLLGGCGRSTMKDMNIDLSALNNVSQQKWDELNGRRIFFGHQSVGFNLVEGLNAVMQEVPQIKLNILETRATGDFNKPVFGHTRIGKNRFPLQKCDDFRSVMIDGMGNTVDIAFFKFCYVDVTRGTDVKAIFDYYVETMKKLEISFPKVRFVHFTVPLTADGTDIKTKIKKMLGLRIENDADNVNSRTV
jgi:hypothetical protein